MLVLVWNTKRLTILVLQSLPSMMVKLLMQMQIKLKSVVKMDHLMFIIFKNSVVLTQELHITNVPLLKLAMS